MLEEGEIEPEEYEDKDAELIKRLHFAQEWKLLQQQEREEEKE